MQSTEMKMSLRDFERKFCLDILERYHFTQRANVQDGIFDFDGTEDGDPVIYAKDGTVIPLHDIITMSKDDFKTAYPGMSPREAFANYLSNYTVRTGEDAVFEHNRSLADLSARTKLARQLLDCDFSSL